MIPARPVLKLFVTEGCGLCGPFLEALAELAALRGFDVEVRDLLREEAETRLRHRYDVPVVLADGRVLARHHWSEAAVQAVEAWLRGTSVAG